MHQTLIAISIVLITVGIYFAMVKVYKYLPYPVFLPVLTTTIVLVLLLTLSHVSYEEYMIGGKWINALLGPGVVALAYPLYKNRKILIENIFPIVTGVFTGMIFGMVSGLLFAEAFGIGEDLILSIIPKSITTPVAIQISSGLGGIPSMTAVFVMIAGLSGVTFGPRILKWSRIDSYLGKGIAFGSSSHALGTAKTFEYGELAGSMSSVSMTLSAVFGTIFGPIIAWAFHIF